MELLKLRQDLVALMARLEQLGAGQIHGLAHFVLPELARLGAHEFANCFQPLAVLEIVRRATEEKLQALLQFARDRQVLFLFPDAHSVPLRQMRIDPSEVKTEELQFSIALHLWMLQEIFASVHFQPLLALITLSSNI